MEILPPAMIIRKVHIDKLEYKISSTIFYGSVSAITYLEATYLLKCDNNKPNENVDHKERNDDDIDHIKHCHMRT